MLFFQRALNESRAAVLAVMAMALWSPPEGRPDIRGPRIPKSWSGSDYCPG